MKVFLIDLLIVVVLMVIPFAYSMRGGQNYPPNVKYMTKNEMVVFIVFWGFGLFYAFTRMVTITKGVI